MGEVLNDWLNVGVAVGFGIGVLALTWAVVLWWEDL